MTVYFISGLGADKRIFQKLTFPENWIIKHVVYINNIENEKLSDYCKRLAQQIDTTVPFSLVGLSFGGIVAVELNKFLRPEMTIIISSISTQQQMPVSFRICGKLKLYAMIPSAVFSRSSRIANWLFGTKNTFEKKLLDQIIKESSVTFIQWAIRQILTWKNNTKPERLFHIHGTADRLFPITNITPDSTIKGGGHFMILTQSDAINKILIEKLNELQS